jgi:hypothetical protein
LHSFFKSHNSKANKLRVKRSNQNGHFGEIHEIEGVHQLVMKAIVWALYEKHKYSRMEDRRGNQNPEKFEVYVWSEVKGWKKTG